MTDATAQWQPPADAQVSRKGTGLLALLVGGLVLLAIAGVAWLVGSNQLRLGAPSSSTEEAGTVSLVTEDKQQPSWQLAKSQWQAFPYQDNGGTISLIRIDQNQVVVKENLAQMGGSEITIINTAVQGSPDLTKVALITKDNRLAVMSADGASIAYATAKLHATKINGWSGDGRYVLVVSEPLSLESVALSMAEGPGRADNPPSSQQFNRELLPKGLYIVDSETGEVTLLAPLTETRPMVLRWVGDHQILSSQSPFNSLGESPVSSWTIFDVDTFVADYSTFYQAISNENFFGVQSSFANDGRTWAFTQHDVNAGTAAIVIAPFPQIAGRTAVEGRFAFVQNPLIGPDGTKLLFSSRDQQNAEQFVELWKDTGTLSRVAVGYPVRWVDANTFLYAEMNPAYSSVIDNHLVKLFKYDVITGTSTLLFERQVQNP